MPFPRSFVCGHCGVDVSLDAPGTSYRNHCPSCLWSRHLDRNVPGDRKADCPGSMEPIAITIRGERRWMLIHRCTRCGRLRMNRTAADDNVLLLMQLAALPLATPPLPHLSAATPPAQSAKPVAHPACGDDCAHPKAAHPPAGAAPLSSARRDARHTVGGR